jgi:pimeloyl-ACP methyl ester carboxylesterase
VNEQTNDFMHYIHIKEKEKLPKMVLIHGYGGGAHNYFKVAKFIASQFELVILDLPGMGLSS